MFPLAHADQWEVSGYSALVTVVPFHGGPLNSVQNGIMLRADIHTLFDHYKFSINADVSHGAPPSYVHGLLKKDDLKIVYLMPPMNDLPGSYIDPSVVNNPHGTHPDLMRWHHRQAVLANVRGLGEPAFEHDFPPGTDMMGEIQSGPKAAERMDFELASRLATGSRLK